MHFASMADVIDDNLSDRMFDFVDDAIITHSQTIQLFSAFELERLTWKRFVFQCFDALKNSRKNFARQSAQVFFDRRLKNDAVRAHLFPAVVSSLLMRWAFHRGVPLR